MTDHLAASPTGSRCRPASPPFAQVVAGLDVAAWDAVAQRAGTPLWRLGAEAHNHVLTAYASGIDSADIQTLIPPLQQAGWHAYKLKVGFGTEEDRRALGALRAAAGPDASLMVDANQAWEFPQAERQIRALAGEGLHWVEEPIAADRPADEWRLAEIGPALAAARTCAVPKRSRPPSTSASRCCSPTIIKWGGMAGAARITRSPATPASWGADYLAGGVGLAASAARCRPPAMPGSWVRR